MAWHGSSEDSLTLRPEDVHLEDWGSLQDNLVVFGKLSLVFIANYGSAALHSTSGLAGATSVPSLEKVFSHRGDKAKFRSVPLGAEETHNGGC